MKKLSDKTSLIAAILFAVLASVLRTIQLTSLLEYPSGFYATGNEYFNIIMYAVFALAIVVIMVCAVHDTKGRVKKNIYDMSRPAASVFGFMSILCGAASLVALIASFGGSVPSMIAVLLNTIAYFSCGLIAFSAGKIKAPCTVGAVLIILSLIIRSVFFYLENPLITNVPQKLMMMAFLIIGSLFWLNTGRLFSDGGKKLTKPAAIAFGFVTAIVGISTVVSNYVLMGTNGENWLLLTDTPDVEFIVTTFAIAIMTAAIVLGCKKTEAEAQAEADIPEEEVKPEAENLQTSDEEAEQEN